MVFNNRNIQKRRFSKLFLVIGYMPYFSKGRALMKICIMGETLNISQS